MLKFKKIYIMEVYIKRYISQVKLYKKIIADTKIQFILNVCPVLLSL